WGQNAGLWSLNTPFSESEAGRVNAMLDHVYTSFIERVSKGRGLTPEQVDKIAGGRVWSGAKAVQNGLVDQLGGLREALNYTAKRRGVADKNDIDVVVLPEPQSALERFIEFLDSQGDVYENLKFQEKIVKLFAPVMEAAQVFENGRGIATYEPLKVE